MSPGRIRLTIDRVVLHGIPQQNRAALVRGLRGELERLLATPDFTKSLRGRQVASMSGGALRVAADATGATLGKRAAQRIAHRIRETS